MIDDDEENDPVLLCDSCDAEHKLSQLEITTIPEGEWFCPSCAKRKKEEEDRKAMEKNNRRLKKIKEAESLFNKGGDSEKGEDCCYYPNRAGDCQYEHFTWCEDV